MSDTPDQALGATKPRLRYVVTAVCHFQFVTGATPHQEKDIPARIEEAIRTAVESYTTRNTSASVVEFVAVSELSDG